MNLIFSLVAIEGFEVGGGTASSDLYLMSTHSARRWMHYLSNLHRGSELAWMVSVDPSIISFKFYFNFFIISLFHERFAYLYVCAPCTCLIPIEAGCGH